MFTGIVEEVGKIVAVNPESEGRRLSIESSVVYEGTRIGDSIAINGTCQTVEKIEGKQFTVFTSKVSEDITTLSKIKKGDRVNLERALTPTTRMGGHIVQGHVDCIGTIFFTKKSNDALEMRVHVDSSYIKYVANKGSITVNGVSLTVVSVTMEYFVLYLIPQSIDETNLRFLKDGDEVNVEVDILAKYVESLLGKSGAEKKSIIDVMQGAGFI